MNRVWINYSISMFTIDGNSIINGFISCFGIIIAIIGYSFLIKLFLNFNKKHKILKEGYISLLLWENRICIKNAKKKCSKVTNDVDLENIYNDLFNHFKNCGFYIINQYRLNRDDSWFNLGNMWVPVLITFVTNFICDWFEFGANKFLYMIIAITLTFVAMYFGPEADALNIHKDFLIGDELINLFYSRYPHFKELIKFELNYLSNSDIDFMEKKLAKYLKIIRKIQKIENEKPILESNIDIFNFAREDLKDLYGLSESEIEIYLGFKTLRDKHIENNKYK